MKKTYLKASALSTSEYTVIDAAVADTEDLGGTPVFLIETPEGDDMPYLIVKALAEPCPINNVTVHLVIGTTSDSLLEWIDDVGEQEVVLGLSDFDPDNLMTIREVRS